MIVTRMRHALMNMSGFAVRVPDMLDLRWTCQAMRQSAVCKGETDRRDEAKGIERNENARSLYPHDPGQLRQHPEIGTPARRRSRERNEQYSQRLEQARCAEVTATSEPSIYCLISHSGSGLRRCIAGPIWTKASRRRSK